MTSRGFSSSSIRVFRSGPAMLPPLGPPVDWVTAMPLRAEAMTPAPGMSCVIRPVAAPSMTTRLSP